MHIDTSKSVQRGKTYIRHLLRETYREDGKSKHRTIANLSSCSDKEIAAMKLALKHKDNLSELLSDKNNKPKEGMRVGAVLCLNAIADRLGISKALGGSRNGKLALWQVIARLLDHGSRLSVDHLAKSHSACEILGVRSFNERNLSSNLKWLSVEQKEIEKQLFKIHYGTSNPQLFLYDVTSFYLEGLKNIFAVLGDNRKVKGNNQHTVIGLLTDHDGYPVSVKVIAINASVSDSVVQQIDNLAKSFSNSKVILVGDWEILKTSQLHKNEKFHYISAMTKEQIKKIYDEGLLEKTQFDKYLGEVYAAGVCYIIRIDPKGDNEDLLFDDISYVIKTDVPANQLTTIFIDEKYKYLGKIQKGFRTIQEGHSEKQSALDLAKPSTVGGIFVTMLAYIIERELDRCWQNLGLTVAEGIDELGSIRTLILNLGDTPDEKIPQAEGIRKILLEAADVKLPDIFAARKIQVTAS